MLIQDMCRVNDADKLTTVLPLWIKDKVIPSFTVASVNYFQSLPGKLCCVHLSSRVSDLGPDLQNIFQFVIRLS